jgi:hypothetical protein
MLLLRLVAEMALVEAIRRAITSKKLARTRQKVGKIIEKNIIAGNFSAINGVKTDDQKWSEVAYSLNSILEELVAIRVELTDRDAQRQNERAQDRAIAAATRKPWTPWS